MKYIKVVFGNHDSLQKFVRYVTSKDKKVYPPWPPILYRSVNTNYTNSIMVNAKSQHAAYTKQLLKEFISKSQHAAYTKQLLKEFITKYQIY